MNNYIRKLAKQYKFQNLFSIVKDLKSISLFKNNIDLTNVQMTFLNYLYMYEHLYRDIDMNKVSKHVVDDDIFEDAYLLWKRKKPEEKEDNNSNEMKMVNTDKINFPKR
jgi:hypothetical protein